MSAKGQEFLDAINALRGTDFTLGSSRVKPLTVEGMAMLDMHRDKRPSCPCCGSKEAYNEDLCTLGAICPQCQWERDEYEEGAKAMFPDGPSGPNGMSLEAYRRKYTSWYATVKRYLKKKWHFARYHKRVKKKLDA